MTDDIQQAAAFTRLAIEALDRAGASLPAAMLDHALQAIEALRTAATVVDPITARTD